MFDYLFTSILYLTRHFYTSRESDLDRVRDELEPRLQENVRDEFQENYKVLKDWLKQPWSGHDNFIKSIMSNETSIKWIRILLLEHCRLEEFFTKAHFPGDGQPLVTSSRRKELEKQYEKLLPHNLVKEWKSSTALADERTTSVGYAGSVTPPMGAEATSENALTEAQTTVPRSEDDDVEALLNSKLEEFEALRLAYRWRGRWN